MKRPSLYNLLFSRLGLDLSTFDIFFDLREQKQWANLQTITKPAPPWVRVGKHSNRRRKRTK